MLSFLTLDHLKLEAIVIRLTTVILMLAPAGQQAGHKRRSGQVGIDVRGYVQAVTPGAELILEAPLSVAEAGEVLVFSHWEVDGRVAAAAQAAIEVEMTGDRSGVAVYVAASPDGQESH